jgi:cell wall-associated NlpC family hydrolase
MRRMITATLACMLATVPALAEKIVLGKLGQVTEATRIYERPSTGSTVYYKIKAYEYVVVKPKDDHWMKVLLQNGRYGYVESDCVAKLPYEVSANQGSSRTTNYASRSGSGFSASNSLAAQYALNFIGTPYVWGGEDLRGGIDCSGLVMKSFQNARGVNLPRTAAEQVNVGIHVNRLEELRPGDRLYFWDSKRGKVGHCGIYLGKGYFVHSSRTHNGVATDYLGSPKWLHMLVAARRS